MSSGAEELLKRHFDIALETPDGVKKLRELILTLAMQGKLVKQDPKDQPAIVLLKEIEAEKKRLIKDGRIKNQDSLPPIKPEEIPYEIPKKWEWVRLGNLMPEFQNGISKRGSNSGIETIVIRLADITGFEVSLTDTRSIKLTKEEFSKYQLKEHDILITRVNGSIDLVGSFIQASNLKNITYCDHFIRMRLAHGIADSQFICKIAGSSFLRKQIKSKFITTAGQKTVNQGHISSLILSLPPLAEQKRIVAKIDQLMALCDKLESQRNERRNKRLKIHAAAINKLITAPDKSEFNTSWNFITKNFSELYSVKENVEELKKAILQLAVMGKLVKQDLKDQPASELLKEIEAEKKRLVKEGKIKKQELLPPIKPEEIPYEVPIGWEWVRLGGVSLINGGFAFKSSQYVQDGVRVIRISDFDEKGFKNDKVVRYTFSEDLVDFLVEENNILMAMTGGTVGKSYLVRMLPEKMVVNQRVATMKLYKNIVPHYINALIQTSLIQNVIQNAKNSTNDNISMGDIKGFFVPLPPLAEQKRIVAKIDQLMELCNVLGQQIKDSTNKQTAILDSVLARL
jgi:type I restriction enzyme S subunit